jgi:hypothetical protein
MRTTALKSFVQVQRQLNPISDRESLMDEEGWHCRIIGGEFMGWKQRHLPDIIGQCKVLRMMGFDPQPLIVFTTTMAGIVTAQEIISRPSKDLVYLLHTEFREWEKEQLRDSTFWD